LDGGCPECREPIEKHSIWVRVEVVVDIH
jgi:hypothetical protein